MKAGIVAVVAQALLVDEAVGNEGAILGLGVAPLRGIGAGVDGGPWRQAGVGHALRGVD